MCFWNLIPCKFVILELTTVRKFSCILGVYFQTFEYWTHSYIIIGLYFGFRKPNSCLWYGSEFIWTYLNFNVFWTWHSHLDLDLFEMWNECFLWVYSGYTMGMFLLYSGYSMGILWVYYGYTLSILWVYFGEEGFWWSRRSDMECFNLLSPYHCRTDFPWFLWILLCDQIWSGGFFWCPETWNVSLGNKS